MKIINVDLSHRDSKNNLWTDRPSQRDIKRGGRSYVRVFVGESDTASTIKAINYAHKNFKLKDLTAEVEEIKGKILSFTKDNWDEAESGEITIDISYTLPLNYYRIRDIKEFWVNIWDLPEQSILET